MRALFLILILTTGAQARLFAEEQPAKVPPPHELLEQARQAAKQAQQSHVPHKYPEAVELYSRFILNYPTHDEAPSALKRLGTLYRATYKNREALMHALHKLAEQGEQSAQYVTAMKWIKENEAVLEWKFGKAPSLVRATKDQGIKVALGNVFWRRAYVPTYRLYRIPPRMLESKIEKSNVGFSGTHLLKAEDVPRERWESVSFRAELFKPAPDDPRAALYARSGRQGELFDTLHADLSAGGLFVLEQEIEGFRERTVLHVPKFGLFCKAVGNETFVYAADPWTGQPIKNLKVDLRLDDKLLISRSANTEGFVRLPNGEVSSDRHAVVTARLEGDLQAHSLYYLSSSSQSNTIAFITTDRPIYRPNQTVQFKAVIRERVKGTLKRPQDQKLRVEIRGPEGRLLQSQEYAVNEFGSLSGSFQLTAEPALGEYGIIVHVQRPLGNDDADWLDNDWEKYWSQTFEVAEYRKPEFEVTVSPQGGSSLLGDKMKATIKARYYFGGAVNAADVQWTVVSSESTKGIDTQQFKPFEDPRAWFYESQPVFGDGSIGTSFGCWNWWGMPDELVASGDGRTDEQGNLEITFDTQPGESPVKYTITATVRDATRMTAIGSADIEAHPSPYEISLGTTRLFYEPGEEIDARVRIKMRDGNPVANQQLTLSAFMQLGDGSVSEAEFESFLTEQLCSDDQGLATAKFAAKESGRLRLRVEVKTSQGNKVVARSDLWIAGQAAVTQDQYNFGTSGGLGRGLGGGGFGGFGFGTSDVQDDESLYLTIDSDLLAYSPGETMRLMVRSSQAPLTALLLIEGDEVHSTKVIRLSKQCEVLEIPATRDMPSRARISLLAWSGGEFDWGSTEFVVYPAENLLDVAIEVGQSNYAPREKAHVSLKVTDKNGKPVAAEVELGIVDQSLFDLAEDNSFDIRSFFFPSPALQGMSSYAHVTVPYEERYAEDRFADLVFGTGRFGGSGGGFGGGGFGGGLGGGGGFFGGGAQRPFVTSVTPVLPGGGGDDVGGPGAAMPAETEVRSKFADTFYWSAHVQVGSDGKADLDLEVPDTLGQWRIVARAISSSDRFGIATSSVVSRKDVIVRLSAPRFFTQGDQATVSTVVNNNLEKETTFSIKLECEGAVAGGQQTRTIPAGGQVRIDWPINVEQSGTVTLRAKALSETASDAMEIKLPVRPCGIEKRIARNGRLEKGKWNTALVIPEDADLASAKLEIVVSSASTAAIRDALPYLADYPYGCVEQTMSRFLPAVVASGAMQRQGIENKGLAEALPHMVEQGLQRLYGFQHEDGGWGWWKHDETDKFMTTYVVFGLLTAQHAGYEISPQILLDGVEAVQSNGLTPFSAYVLRMAKADLEISLDDFGGPKDAAPDPFGDGGVDPFGGGGPNPFGDAREMFRRGEFFVTLPAAKRSFSTEDLAYLVLAGFKDLAVELPADPPKHSNPNLVRTTALVVRALASVDPKDKRIPPLVDWLMQQRRGGAWYSTLDTAYAVFALSTLAEPGENPPVQVSVNGKHTESMSGRVLLSGKDIRWGTNKIEIHHPDGKPIAYASVLLNYFATDLDKPAEKDAPLAVRRKFERAVIVDGEKHWRPIESGGKISIDDELRVTTIVNNDAPVERVMIESPLPAGTEPRVDDADDDVYWDYWFGRRELRDDRVSIAANHLYGDDNQFEFRLRPTLPGRYHVLPARVFPMYNPDEQAHSPPFVIEVVDSK